MSRGVRLVFLGLILLVVASLALSGFAISRSSELSGKIAELNKQNAQLSSLSKTFGPRTATIVVAAANSRSKGQADFTADNKDDQKAIQAAIDSLPTNGGKVILLEGTYNITAPIKITKPYE